MTTARIELPPKLVPVFAKPRGAVQYRGAYGGRGSGKSFNFAKMAAIWGYTEPLRILCVREFQVSIAESFHAELKAAIASEPWLDGAYEIGRDYLRGKNGTEFIFRGLRRNTQSIKSLAKIDLTIVEEAEDVPEESWLALEATVFRQPKSELWSIWNPRDEGSPVDQRFRKCPPDNAVIVEMNWQDNPFFPEGLKTLREREQSRLDPNTYAHVWEGAYLENSDRQVFGGKVKVDEFTPGPDWDGPYQGVDFGFRPDPLCAGRVWVHDDRVWIEREAYGVGVEIDAMAGFIKENIPDFDQYVTRADSAEPKTISYARRNGLPRIEPVKKWPNSVMEGIRFLRGFREIVIHPRCPGCIRDFRLYSHKVNTAGDVLPDLIDADNHGPDMVRYALAPLIKGKPTARTFIGKGFY
ncbi:PBSX family phage terminase large subunit [Oricola thermophila]|uniref:PBSX family phage terminase large subunit n=1 Tax=Oricola thermophila TaxID=2742145 RepID=A0A6N1VE16_9HYPH|nr:phage terminase large subunit [Oricola thermophila]QKV17845.1 PBSX family phage terminase large subunit [Oricola thermophila]